MTALVLFLVLLGLLSQALGFVPTRNAGARGGNAPALTPTTRSMFGGGGSKAKAVTIKVEGKTITPATSPCNLRKELISAGVDVYPLKAKITGNCGGAGICGTCAVRVLDGAGNINPPSKNEQNTLRGKPADIRLSCCARVSGPISIKTKP